MLAVFSRILDIDHNVKRVLLFRIWTIFSGFIIIAVMPYYLTNENQGYYYTFLSLVALQVLFDLGFTQTIIQISSHEFAHINLISKNKILFNKQTAKLAYIKSIIILWYRYIGSAFIIMVAIAGIFYFSFFEAESDTQWLGPWIALVISTGMNLILSPRLALVEGAGHTGAVALLRLTQSIIGHILFVAGLVIGGGLWSVVAVPFAACLCSYTWLRWRENPFRAIPKYAPGVIDHVPWRIELIGLQARVAIAWLGGYLASQSIIPIVFALQGANAAGRLGLGLQIFSAVQVFGMAWISARAPIFGHLIARGSRLDLHSRYAKAVISAVLVSGIMATTALLLLILASRAELMFADRIPSTFALMLLASVAILGTIIHALAAFIRAHKEEPLVFSSLAIGSATLAAVGFAGQISIDAVVIAYAGITAFVNLPWTLIIFRRYYFIKKIEVV